MALPEGRRAGPTAALFTARVVYAFNWYNVGAVLPLVGIGLHAGPAELGIVLGAFLAGVGIFQLPAGVAALRWGSRNVSIGGIALLGSAGLLSGFAPTWPILALLRFVAGVGAAFFFSPALSLIASYYPPGRRGPVIGLYNGGFSAGGALGLFAGAYLGLRFGWGPALSIGGGVLVIVALACWALIPSGTDPTPPPDRTQIWATTRAIVTSRSIWALSLGLTGYWGAIYIAAQYLPDFVTRVHPAWGLGLGAGLAALVVIVSFPAGPLGGWLGEWRGDRRVLLALGGLLSGVLVLLVPSLGLPFLVTDLLLLGTADGVVFAILYLVPSYFPETRGEGLAVGVAVVNSIQVSLGSLLAVVFGYVVDFAGYSVAWIFAGVAALAFLPLLYLVPPSRPEAL